MYLLLFGGVSLMFWWCPSYVWVVSPSCLEASQSCFGIASVMVCWFVDYAFGVLLVVSRLSLVAVR